MSRRLMYQPCSSLIPGLRRALMDMPGDLTRARLLGAVLMALLAGCATADAPAALGSAAIGVSCGDLATAHSIPSATCEWNGNGACGGNGVPTADCDGCCSTLTCGDYATAFDVPSPACEAGGNAACNG